MTCEMALFLLSEAGRALLSRADALRLARSETLPALMQLRRLAAPEQASAAWEMSDLRLRAAAKFGPQAAAMYFVREALEQASSARAAAYHAERFARADMASVADLCGGIGGDALAFAARGLRVTLSERDPARALFARENAAVCGVEDRVIVIEADAATAPISAEAVWFDPARRREARRITDPEAYLPPLSLIRELSARGIGTVGVKLSPAIDHALASAYGAELEFISDGGECKEALLWAGALTTGEPLRAVKLTESGPIFLAGTADEGLAGGIAERGAYLYEPDPAVIRAHLVRTLAAQLDAAPVHPEIAYLIGDTRIQTPWASAYEIEGRFPYSRRRLQEALSARGVGRVVIKKRGFPQEPDDVRRGLKLKGNEEITVVLTRLGDGHQAILCRPFTHV
jgi:hypothetical protein